MMVSELRGISVNKITFKGDMCPVSKKNTSKTKTDVPELNLVWANAFNWVILVLKR